MPNDTVFCPGFSGVLYFILTSGVCHCTSATVFFQDKLQSLAGQHSDILETLSPTVRKRVDVLREMQVGLHFDIPNPDYNLRFINNSCCSFENKPWGQY